MTWVDWLFIALVSIAILGGVGATIMMAYKDRLQMKQLNKNLTTITGSARVTDTAEIPLVGNRKVKARHARKR